jgi:hypothetical protein
MLGVSSQTRSKSDVVSQTVFSSLGLPRSRARPSHGEQVYGPPSFAHDAGGAEILNRPEAAGSGEREIHSDTPCLIFGVLACRYGSSYLPNFALDRYTRRAGSPQTTGALFSFWRPLGSPWNEQLILAAECSLSRRWSIANYRRAKRARWEGFYAAMG